MKVPILIILLLFATPLYATDANGRTYLQMTRDIYDKYYSEKDFIPSEADSTTGLVVYRTYEKVPDAVCGIVECSEVAAVDAAEVKEDGILKTDAEKEDVADPIAVDASVQADVVDEGEAAPAEEAVVP